MPNIDIYKNNQWVETKNFRKRFYILEIDSVIYWETSEEILNSQEQPRKFSVIKAVIRGSGLPPVIGISHIGASWQLTIDGIKMDKTIYQGLEAAGKKIELEKDEYKFVCQLPSYGEQK